MNGETNSNLQIFKAITTFVFDVDGVLTNGHLLIMPNGHFVRQMNIKDGYALQLAIKQNYQVIIISGGTSLEIEKRLKLLGISHIYLGVKNKKALLFELCNQLHLELSTILYMGDDMPDYSCMQQVGLAACPNDACFDIKEISNYWSPYNGGEGCVRDVIEKVLKIQNLWHNETKLSSI
ncbi:MAG: HAD-IIIA family hydrolase [Alphaproteobacteria bacterium]|nr:HAD-IIIA family hydrolase [Alphaproteobacteria bacterium]